MPRPQNDTEQKIFDAAVMKAHKSGAKAKDLMAAGKAAVAAHRKGSVKAIDKSLRGKISNRQQRIDEASGFGGKPKKKK